MKTMWVLLGCIFSPWVWATEWLTITGDLSRPTDDIVQVDPLSVVHHAGLSTLTVRVNRNKTRRNWDGVAYRSYEGWVLVRCEEATAAYLRLRMYAEPLWQGAVKEKRYSDPLPPMRFVGIPLNPTARIVRAACASPRARPS